MITNNDFQTISELDLDPIKVKLMHKESGEGWTLEKANAVAFEYRRFLHLMKKFPTEQTAPLVDVDTFWHYHILDTMKYEADCQAVFGYFLHHFPYIGLRGEDDEAAHQRIGARMKELYEETFGESYIRSEGALQKARPETAAMTAWSAAAIKAAKPEVSAMTAWSAAAIKAAKPEVSALTAWSAAAIKAAKPEASALTAWSAAAIKAAKPEVSALTAWSAVAIKTGRPIAAATEDAKAAEVARFYSERPVLASVA
jgi:hypothetical protein